MDAKEENPSKFTFYYITPRKGAVKQLFAEANAHRKA